MEQTSRSQYEEEVSWLRERCLLLNRDPASHQTTMSNGDATLQAAHLTANRDGRIRFEAEFRFMLARHWTLFDSMLHSRFMATRLGVWREKGRRMLETFLAKMGIPLAQCKTDYSSMELELKESLPLRIAKHASEFGLGDVSLPSFVRDYGFIMRLSASDAVYALMALIEAPYAASQSGPLHEEKKLTQKNTSDTKTTMSSQQQQQPTTAIWIKNFFHAFEALD